MQEISLKSIGWDPTWSPDGNQILFASSSARNGAVICRQPEWGRHAPGVEFACYPRPQRLVSGWTIHRDLLGTAWNREVYIMNADGSNVRQLTPSGGNSQGPSFSPDGKWVVFTAYFDNYGDDHGCEIYIIRIDGTDLRRLTNNDYCDYQPRWGP